MDNGNNSKKPHQLNSSISPHFNQVFLNRKADGDNAKQSGEEVNTNKNGPSNQNNTTSNQIHQNNQMLAINSNINQLNGGVNQGQQYQFPPPGFWTPQHGPPTQAGNHFDQGGHTHNVGSYSCQVPSGNVNNPMNVPRNVGPIPNAFYPFGYPSGPPSPYSAGPWDPSVWWNQMQQFLPFGACPFPGATNYFPPPAPQPTPNCSAPEKSSPKGATQQSANMFQKDQSLCDAQVPENVRLWTAIAALHANFAWALRRLTELDTEIKSLKSEREQRITHDIVSPSTEQTRKRGRPKKFVDSSDSSPSPIPPLPIPPLPIPPQVNTRPALSKAPLIKEINFQKNHKDKAEFMGTVSPLIPPSHLVNGPNFTNIPKSPRSSMVTNSSQAKFAITNQQLIEQVTREGMHVAATPQGFYSQVNVSHKGTGEVETRMNESNDDSEELDEGTTDSEKDENEDTANVAATCPDDEPPLGARD